MQLHNRMNRAARTPRQRMGVWTWLVILASLTLSTGTVLTAADRLAEFDLRIDQAMEYRDRWRVEMASAQSELDTELAQLRGELTELRGGLSADQAGFHSELDALGARVGRIEGRVAALWREPTNGMHARLRQN